MNEIPKAGAAVRDDRGPPPGPSPARGGPPDAAGGEVVRGAAAVGLAGLLTRVLGLVREAALAYYFGAGAARDALGVALRIPNILRDLFAEGSLTAAFVPNFTEYDRNQGAKAAVALAQAVIGFLLVVVGAIVLSLVVFGERWILLFAGGFADDPEQLRLATRLTQVAGPFLLLASLSAVVAGTLNVRGRFFLPAIAPALFNVVGVLSCLLAEPFARTTGQPAILAVGIGFTLGGVAQLAAMLPAARRLGFRFWPRFNFAHPGLRRVVRLMVPGVIGLAGVSLTNLIDVQVASRWTGAVAYIDYAFRLILFPIGIVAMALATSTLAVASRDVADGDSEGLRRTVSQSVVLLGFLSLPAAAAFVVLREPLAQFFYMQGRFGPEDASRTGWVLALYALGLMGYSYPRILLPIFYALGDSLRPMLLTLLTIAAKAGLVWALLAPFEARTWAEPYYALPLASAIAVNGEAVVLLLLLRSRIGPLTPSTWPALLRISLATAAAAAAGWAVLRLLPASFEAPGKALQMVKLAASGGAMALAYVAAALALRVEEMRALVQKIKEGPKGRPGRAPA